MSVEPLLLECLGLSKRMIKWLRGGGSFVSLASWREPNCVLDVIKADLQIAGGYTNYAAHAQVDPGCERFNGIQREDGSSRFPGYHSVSRSFVPTSYF